MRTRRDSQAANLENAIMKIELETVCYATTFIATLVFCLPLRAEPPTANGRSPPSRVVHYADLDLSTDDGAHILYRRIKDAAWQVCRDALDEPAGIPNAKCWRAAVQAAVEKVNRPALTAVYRGEQPSALTAHR
jgi:UrcA family protein